MTKPCDYEGSTFRVTRRDCGPYVARFGGQTASSTASAAIAARRLAGKLCPHHPLTATPAGPKHGSLTLWEIVEETIDITEKGGQG